MLEAYPIIYLYIT